MKRLAPSPSEDLRLGRRALEVVDGYRCLTDLTWSDEEERWTLQFQLDVVVPSAQVKDATVPSSTAWFVIVNHAYPLGEIEIFPAANGGLTETYPHQLRNDLADGALWRDGKVCVATPYAGLGRWQYDTEPRTAEERLRWHIERTKVWIDAAMRGELLADGEPFELPIYAPIEGPVLAFAGQAANITALDDLGSDYGYATVATPPDAPGVRVLVALRAFGSTSSKEMSLEWGTALSGPWKANATDVAVWMRLPTLPVVPPWRAPATWGELTSCLQGMGLNLMETLRQLAPELRDKAKHFLLLGAPISEVQGEPPVKLHWIALQLPILSAGNKTAHGFRPGEGGYWQRDRHQVLTKDTPLAWVPTADWSPDQIATRGRLGEALRSTKIVLVGAGALGAVVAELLVRGGVKHLTILDGDSLAVGNLVRHTLELRDVRRAKATAAAAHLNGANPHATVVGIKTKFPDEGEGDAALGDADLILDCTGEDRVVAALTEREWPTERLFVSAAVGLFANRLFMFAQRSSRFDATAYASAINPWLCAERIEFGSTELPWEGIGCWHPVFPARADDFALWGATVVRYMEAVASGPASVPGLVVLERECGPDGVLTTKRGSLPKDAAGE